MHWHCMGCFILLCFVMSFIHRSLSLLKPGPFRPKNRFTKHFHTVATMWLDTLWLLTHHDWIPVALQDPQTLQPPPAKLNLLNLRTFPDLLGGSILVLQYQGALCCVNDIWQKIFLLLFTRWAPTVPVVSRLPIYKAIYMDPKTPFITGRSPTL